MEKNLPREVVSIITNVHICQNDVGKYDDSVMLVKLAERLHNMRTIEFMDQAEKEKRAKETFEIFMPLARKLGNDKLISELNDLSLKYM